MREVKNARTASNSDDEDFCHCCDHRGAALHGYDRERDTET